MDNNIRSLISFCVTVGLAIVYMLFCSYIVEELPNSSTTTTDIQSDYDYVIIGGGTAGSVLASRLSENKNISVLVLEAGDHYNNVDGIHDPAMAMTLQHSSADWDYISMPNSGFLGNLEQKHFIPSGKVLGGSSAINYNVFVRGSPLNFDEWATKYGCKGWGYKDLLPYFKKCESMQVDRLRQSEYHGTSGPIAVSELPLSPLYDNFISAAGQLGYEELDYNGDTQSGFGPIQYSIRKGVRSSAGKEYLSNEIILTRTNLAVAVNSFVTRIHIENKVAKGVHYIKDGTASYVAARREVIVSAGALKSPHILMLSGIGPKNHLEKLGIPVVCDLPVGERLENHVGVSIHADFDQTHRPTNGDPETKAPLVMQGFLHVDKSNIKMTKPDIQLVLSQVIFDLSDGINYDPNIAEEITNSISNSSGFSALIFLTKPKSSGTVKLETSDPFAGPIYDVNQLAYVDDVNMLIKGIRQFEELISSEALKQFGVDLEINRYSFCSDHEFRSDAFWECFIYHTGYIGHHHTSTCRMGAPSDPTTVVDLSLRVKGVANLRVCDASVFSTVTTGNTYAPTLAIAEKAADIIQQQQ